MRRAGRRLVDLGRNFLGILLLILPVPAGRRWFHFTLDQTVAVLALVAVAEVSLRRAEFRGDVSFWPWALSNLAALYLLNLLVCYIVAGPARARGAAAGLSLLVLGARLWFGVLHVLVARFADDDGRFSYGEGWDSWTPADGTLEALLLVFAVRAIHLVRGGSWRRAIGVGALLWLGILLPEESVLIVRPWYVAREHDYPKSVDEETVFYAQDRLMRRALDAVETAEPGPARTYFVGFAGNGDQDVFLKEARSARTLFDEAFATHGRSVLLVNNPQTTGELPIASMSNLRIALKAMARKMNLERDVLVLYVTSHGWAGGLSVSLNPMRLYQMTPTSLRAALDEAGIKWRVVIISSCYSGSFVDRLADSDTLVMTAAAGDRTSFGCADENDFTYFGEALIGHALQHNHSLIGAFHEAEQAIAAREKAEDLTPSEPQISIGDRIEGKLAEVGAGP